MRAVIYQHEAHEGPLLLGEALRQAGFTLVNRFRSVQREDVDADLLLVMGGTMGVYEAELHPFLREELGILAERLAQDRPCLGICLGAQLLASAAGAEVFPGKNGIEVGVAPVRWTREGLRDPVIAGVRSRTAVAHWHSDTFSSVPGAQLFAATDRYTQQAFRVGRSFGFQFHPELTAAEFGRWLEDGGSELASRGKDPNELKAHLPKLKAAEPELLGLLRRLAQHFARSESTPAGRA